MRRDRKNSLEKKTKDQDGSESESIMFTHKPGTGGEGGLWSNVDWKLNCDDNGSSGKRIRFFTMTRLMMILLFGQLWTTSGVSASFNLFMDRHEAQKLLGLPSDIFYVREGVVNEYALNFIMKVPAAVEALVFAWQATTKRPVQYDMTLEFTDFFALLSPSSNISQTGRVPQKLENFRISLPCSGRINAEVAVNIRFTFHLKSFKGGPLSNNSSLTSKGNTTTINLKRNKICLLKEFISSVDEPLAAIGTQTKSPTLSPQIVDKSGDSVVGGGIASDGHGNGNSGSNGHGGPAVVSNSTLLLFQDPTPSLLLAGLLGGCVVTASIVFLIFFICLRRKLVPSSPLSSVYSSGGGIINSDPNSSNNSSPACLLRQPTGMSESKWTKDESCCDSNEFKDKYLNPNSTLASRNSYVTIASFWNDIFGTHNNSQSQNATTASHSHHQQQQQQRVHSVGHIQHGHGGRFHGHSGASSHSHSHSHVGSHRPPPPAYPQILQHTNYHLNSTFNSPSNQNSTNNSSSILMAKGSDVSPYAYAHIVPKIAPPPPPLIEWYSESSCNNGGHIFTNNLFTFQSNRDHSHSQHSPAHLANPIVSNNCSNNSPSQPPPVPKSQNPGPSPSESNCNGNGNVTDGNASSTTRSAGSGSLIQIDGFQCRKNLVKDGNIVERFL